MHASDGVRAAIQSLAGVYIYDYCPTDAVRQRVNARYAEAEACVSRLLNYWASLEDGQVSEFLTITAILSTQDIVFTELRLKKPREPRWMQGFRQCEHILRMTGPGTHYTHGQNNQPVPLRLSHCVVTGHALTLARCMMALPSPVDLYPVGEVRRYMWLLQGMVEASCEIHGGCGLSRKLLHMISQITYCAARLQQDCDSLVVPFTAQFLHKQLEEMRQWSSEPEADQSGPARIEIPRDNPLVVANLSDLVKCIRILPTSGTLFTAQAPLFPVFLLGMLSIVPHHKDISVNWFQEVVHTPVRSSVSPLYASLMRIWTWIYTEITVLSSMMSENDVPVGHSVNLYGSTRNATRKADWGELDPIPCSLGIIWPPLWQFVEILAQTTHEFRPSLLQDQLPTHWQLRSTIKAVNAASRSPSVGARAEGLQGLIAGPLVALLAIFTLSVTTLFGKETLAHRLSVAGSPTRP
ncbi:hypothetical protein Purlil1_12168 [Purpureocillium lilacinum]|uniref:Uncharacterized protein n=1 Tax=Purpureocillium lilacinum TaxID=33203 RepID=A0ABR0BHS7_PURLI|nr:hypothetical protein Purlil1_12168 [Purpureocillium lilacinum]